MDQAPTGKPLNIQQLLAKKKEQPNSKQPVDSQAVLETEETKAPVSSVELTAVQSKEALIAERLARAEEKTKAFMSQYTQVIDTTPKSKEKKTYQAPLAVDMKAAYQVSMQGLKSNRLDVEQRETRQYPLGYFGVDELYCFAEAHFYMIKKNLHLVALERPRFCIVIHFVGSTKRDYGVVYEHGILLAYQDVSKILNPDLELTFDTDSVIDNIRGKIACHRAQLDSRRHYAGDVSLLYDLKLKTYSGLEDDIEDILDSLDELQWFSINHKMCKDSIDFVHLLMDHSTRVRLPWIEIPTMVKFIFQTSPTVESICHFDKNKFSIIRAKPCEKLPEAPILIRVSQTALEALWNKECGMHALIIASQIQVEGDLSKAIEIGVLDPIALMYVRHFQKTKKPLSSDNPLFIVWAP